MLMLSSVSRPVLRASRPRWSSRSPSPRTHSTRSCLQASTAETTPYKQREGASREDRKLDPHAQSLQLLASLHSCHNTLHVQERKEGVSTGGREVHQKVGART